ncbi:MAG: pectate lyase [Flaviaesturariibacter sp.]|nr:pectate lyase [Flaviaesturariibacter sp.]
MMLYSFRYLAVLLFCGFSSCAQQKKITENSTDGLSIAFPGAEGFGKHTNGGRGGRVFIVSNLNDEGPGSLREALKSKMPKIVVFSISGTIHLESRLSIPANTTIAGQTAPGDGICLADHPVSLGGDNIIVRYMRFRMGDKNQKGGMVHGNGSDDAFGGIGRKNIIIDHCSMSWSTDEVLSVYGGDSVTLQWNIIAEPLNYSYHFETCDKDYEHHGYGGIWGGAHLSAHHNLLSSCSSRNPRFAGIRNFPTELVDYRNNVIYNWGHNNVYGGEGGNYNIVANYYKPGPQTSKSVATRIANPSQQKKPFIPYGKWFVDGNYIEGSSEVSGSNWLGVHRTDGTDEEKAAVKAPTPFDAIFMNTETPSQAYLTVLDGAGAVLPKRDTLDQRIVRDVKNGTGRYIDVQGGFLHGTPYEQTVSAWPALVSLPAPKDSDSDGMPDEWEKAHGLNPTNNVDAASYSLDKHYTNIEVYINSLVK